MKTVAAAIEFGTSKITTLIAENSGYNRCDIIGSGTVPYAGYTGGVWNEPERLREAVEASIHAAEVEAKRSVKDALPLLGEAETKVAYDALGDLRALLRRHLDEFGG